MNTESTVKKLNSLIQENIKKFMNNFIKSNYILSRKAVIINDYNSTNNSASVKFPNDMSTSTSYYYPNRSGSVLNVGQKAYLVYQSGNISQGYIETNTPLSCSVGSSSLSEETKRYLFDVNRPIGSIYFSSTETNPNNIDGWYGLWEEFAIGKTIVGQDVSDELFSVLGKTGGEKEHTLSLEEMPTHDHANNDYFDGAVLKWDGTSNYGVSAGSGVYGSTGAVPVRNFFRVRGAGMPHNNLQPYEVVKMWVRIE